MVMEIVNPEFAAKMGALALIASSFPLSDFSEGAVSLVKCTFCVVY